MKRGTLKNELLDKKWLDKVNEMSTIIITGGGASWIIDEFKKYFIGETKLQDDYQFANAKGYIAMLNLAKKQKNKQK